VKPENFAFKGKD